MDVGALRGFFHEVAGGDGPAEARQENELAGGALLEAAFLVWYKQELRSVASLATRLRGMLDSSAAPDEMELPGDEPLPHWHDLPTDCSFRVAQPTVQGRRRRATDGDKVAQCQGYAKHRRWARVVCGLTETEFREVLRVGSAEASSRKGIVPVCSIDRQAQGGKGLNARDTAIQCCRWSGFRKAVVAAAQQGACAAQVEEPCCAVSDADPFV